MFKTKSKKIINYRIEWTKLYQIIKLAKLNKLGFYNNKDYFII